MYEHREGRGQQHLTAIEFEDICGVEIQQPLYICLLLHEDLFLPRFTKLWPVIYDFPRICILELLEQIQVEVTRACSHTIYIYPLRVDCQTRCLILLFQSSTSSNTAKCRIEHIASACSPLAFDERSTQPDIGRNVLIHAFPFNTVSSLNHFQRLDLHCFFTVL